MKKLRPREVKGLAQSHRDRKVDRPALQPIATPAPPAKEIVIVSALTKHTMGAEYMLNPFI